MDEKIGKMDLGEVNSRIEIMQERWKGYVTSVGGDEEKVRESGRLSIHLSLSCS